MSCRRDKFPPRPSIEEAMQATISVTPRLNGLDTLRAAAIVLVVLYHTTINVTHAPTFGAVGTIGWTGVDLFFVLSGYLIGNQVLSALTRGTSFSLLRFYARRLLRTLPNFYVVLTLYFVFPLKLGGNPPPALWRFLSFTQNVDLQPGTAFSHAWSLCIEEQFYLAFPVVALLLAARRSVRLSWLVLGLAMCAAIIIRSALWQRYGDDGEQYYRHIYYSSWCRFDELLPGVALALLKNFHPVRWRRLISGGNWTLCAGLLATVLTLTLFLNFHALQPDGYRFGMTAFGYPLLACSFALLTLAALSPASWLARVRVPGAGRLALWSYAIYLTHKGVMHLLKTPLAACAINLSSPLALGLMTAMSLLAGWLLYSAVEAPCMRLRERWFGSGRLVPDRTPGPQAVQISEGIPTA